MSETEIYNQIKAEKEFAIEEGAMSCTDYQLCELVRMTGWGAREFSEEPYLDTCRAKLVKAAALAVLQIERIDQKQAQQS